MGDIEYLFTYPHYWKSSLVPHLLIGEINCPAQLTQGWTCHQAEFRHSDLVGSTNGEHSFPLLTPLNILLHTSPYADIPKQYWNPMLDGVNPMNSEVKRS